MLHGIAIVLPTRSPGAKADRSLSPDQWVSHLGGRATRAKMATLRDRELKPDAFPDNSVMAGRDLADDLSKALSELDAYGITMAYTAPPDGERSGGGRLDSIHVLTAADRCCC